MSRLVYDNMLWDNARIGMEKQFQQPGISHDFAFKYAEVDETATQIWFDLSGGRQRSRNGFSGGADAPDSCKVIRKAAPILDIPPAKASMVRAAVRAGFSATRVAKDFGVSVAMVRKLAAT